MIAADQERLDRSVEEKTDRVRGCKCDYMRRRRDDSGKVERVEHPTCHAFFAKSDFAIGKLARHVV